MVKISHKRDRAIFIRSRTEVINKRTTNWSHRLRGSLQDRGIRFQETLSIKLVVTWTARLKVRYPVTETSYFTKMVQSGAQKLRGCSADRLDWAIIKWLWTCRSSPSILPSNSDTRNATTAVASYQIMQVTQMGIVNLWNSARRSGREVRPKLGMSATAISVVSSRNHCLDHLTFS